MSHVEHCWILSPTFTESALGSDLFMVGMSRGELLQRDKPVAAHVQGADLLIPMFVTIGKSDAPAN